MINLSFKKTTLAVGLTLAMNLSMQAFAVQDTLPHYTGSGSITQGPAEVVTSNLFECQNGRSRVAGIGKIKDATGHSWTVPATNHYNSAPKASDLYEECANITPKSIEVVNESAVPVVTIDPEGEVITGYIFADNYFELYINGELIAVDPVPFTPFNSNIVKFKVSKPYTIALKLIDWEENLGLGSENNQGKKYHAGDGGFIASFSDGTLTNADWQAQTFYTAPIYDLSCLSEKDGTRLSQDCTTQGTDKGADAYAIHWKPPENWVSEDFDSTSWPQASIYSEREIGVDNKKSYMNFRDKFVGAGASFIWSTNVVLDNEVLLRFRVK